MINLYCYVSQTSVYGTKLRGADFEDMVAMMLALLDMTEFSRMEFVTCLKTSINRLPKYFNLSPATGDYTIHAENLLDLSLEI